MGVLVGEFACIIMMYLECTKRATFVGKRAQVFPITFETGWYTCTIGTVHVVLCTHSNANSV